MIILWSGSIASIPNGWTLCDGSNGSPDLRNKFVVGAGDTYAVNDTGGSVNHNHAFTGDGHVHGLTEVLREIGDRTTADSLDTDSAQAVGTTDNASSLPPYYALAYIMKL